MSRVSLKSETERAFIDWQWSSQIFNNVVREYSKELSTKFTILVRFGEWQDIEGGSVYLRVLNCQTRLG